MSYQRISTEAKPRAYIYVSGDFEREALHLISMEHKVGCFDGSVEIIFPSEDTTTAESLFVALYDHLKAVGRAIRFNKKTGELRFVQERRK